MQKRPMEDIDCGVHMCINIEYAAEYGTCMLHGYIPATKMRTHTANTIREAGCDDGRSESTHYWAMLQ